nr:hypothetical protein [uncultured Agathobaculum sp.]
MDFVQSDTLQHQVIVVLALYTGMRRAEICGLEGYSPILADMFALKTADFTIDELSEEFIQLVQ